MEYNPSSSLNDLLELSSDVHKKFMVIDNLESSFFQEKQNEIEILREEIKSGDDLTIENLDMVFPTYTYEHEIIIRRADCFKTILLSIVEQYKDNLFFELVRENLQWLTDENNYSLRDALLKIDGEIEYLKKKWKIEKTSVSFP
jgi:hypothetical protein